MLASTKLITPEYYCGILPIDESSVHLKISEANEILEMIYNRTCCKCNFFQELHSNPCGRNSRMCSIGNHMGLSAISKKNCTAIGQ